MSHTNATPNYALSQFISTDTPAWLTDVNGDNQKIDTALYNHAQSITTNAGDIASINTKLSNYLPAAGTTGDVLKKTNTGASWASVDASEVEFDNTGTPLAATDAAAALAELASGLIIYRDYTTPETNFAGGTIGTRAGACEVAIDNLAGYKPIAATIVGLKSSVGEAVGPAIIDDVNFTVKSVMHRNGTAAFSEWVTFRVVYLKV